MSKKTSPHQEWVLEQLRSGKQIEQPVFRDPGGERLGTATLNGQIIMRRTLRSMEALLQCTTTDDDMRIYTLRAPTPAPGR